MFELLAVIIIIILLLALVHERRKFNELTKKFNELTEKYERTIQDYQVLKENFSIEVSRKSHELFNEWKQRELESLKRAIYDSVKKEFEAKFLQWKQEEEKKIRQDAIERSAATIIGKVGEQLAPLLLFSKYNINPKDIRFIGTPVDFVVFKGLSDGNPEEIIFIEVKSGKTANLTPKERAIKELITNKKISWLLLHLSKEIEELTNKSFKIK